ncbi:MAG: hypothetical protein P1V36_02080 [Planctomycetota bacterium]|nr:hypothetical protein [Planctomycetota bacterium]
MPTSSICPHCEGEALYRHRHVAAGAVRGVSLLPDLGSFAVYATMTVVVCRDCGLMRFFTDKDARANLESSSAWTRIGRSKTSD